MYHQGYYHYNHVPPISINNAGYGYNKNKSIVYCANCGGRGHVYKSCNHPVISYGVICYKLFYDQETNSVYPKYLMVQRKDSLCYVEFIRGKYDLKNKDYLLKLFCGMTEKERDNIKNSEFDSLWNDMWCRGSNAENEVNTKNFNKEFKDATEKFKLLKNGYHVLSVETGDPQLVSIDKILEDTRSEYNETEWGFPKGRRNINEDDLSCAFREFKEETGIYPRNIKMCMDYKPLEEVFTGSNKIRYKHVYYIAKYVCPNSESSDSMFDPQNKVQGKEVKDVQWFNYQEAQSKIRGCNVERKELFKRLNLTIMKTIQ
jgi:8-oxo-dGTP pyrophosphatase MutT (NUDIX family)